MNDEAVGSCLEWDLGAPTVPSLYLRAYVIALSLLLQLVQCCRELLGGQVMYRTHWLPTFRHRHRHPIWWGSWGFYVAEIAWEQTLQLHRAYLSNMRFGLHSRESTVAGASRSRRALQPSRHQVVGNPITISFFNSPVLAHIQSQAQAAELSRTIADPHTA